ncbi:MAG: hypothetical protein Q4D16_11605 [Eubacteriales bacterium]|nr:hypothetical protein [Eubacteriales bacterium]
MDDRMLRFTLIFLALSILCFAKKVKIVKLAAEKDGKDVDKSFYLMGWILAGFAILSFIGYIGKDNYLITILVIAGGVLTVIGGIRYNMRSDSDSKGEKEDEGEKKD